MTTDPPIRLAWMDALQDAPHSDEHGGIDPYARAVAFALFRHMDGNGRARPGIRKLSWCAGMSHTIAEDRIRALESAGWLVVERRRGAANRYRATIPTAPPSGTVTAPASGAVDGADRATAPTDGAVPDPDRASRWRGGVEADRATAPASGAELSTTAPDEPKTAPAGGTKPEPVTTPPLHNAVTNEGGAADSPKGPRRQPVTRDLIWRTMARRELDLAREHRPGDDLPPPGGTREKRWLEAVAEGFASQLNDRALEIRHRLPPNDLELWIWQLEPRLAKCGIGPVLARAQADADAARAEQEALVDAMTDDDREARSRYLAEAKAEVEAQRQRMRPPAQSIEERKAAAQAARDAMTEEDLAAWREQVSAQAAAIQSAVGAA